MNSPPASAGSRTATFFEHFIYGGRWVIAPMYVGLLVTLVIYTYHFMVELWDLCRHMTTISESELMLAVLGLIDTTMIGNLALIIMVGSYFIFIRRIQFNAEDRPPWLDKITSSTLKTKMGMSLIGISSIHLLKDFVGAEHVDRELIAKHVVIHLVFIISTVALAYTNKLTHAGEASTH